MCVRFFKYLEMVFLWIELFLQLKTVKINAKVYFPLQIKNFHKAGFIKWHWITKEKKLNVKNLSENLSFRFFLKSFDTGHAIYFSNTCTADFP